MLKNYLTIGVRNLLRHRVFSCINILGLAIGISACLVIFLLVRHELSFDTFHPDRNRIYRVYSKFTGAFEAVNGGVPTGMSALVEQTFTGLENSTAFHVFPARVELLQKTKAFDEQKDVVIVNREYFDFFSSYEWIAGSPVRSLTHPFQVVLTESKAKFYFGDRPLAQILGQEIYYQDSLEVIVTGIVKDLSKPTDFIFNDFISFSTIQQSWLKNRIKPVDWTNTSGGSQLFIKLSEGTPVRSVAAQLQAGNKMYAAKNKGASWHLTFHLQPLADLHFNSQIGIFDTTRSAANLLTLQILSVLALLLLLIAAINFINLITAQAVNRAKEVGVRKVLGSTRFELIRQFLYETLIITILAVGVAIVLTDLSLLYFKEFVPKGLEFKISDSFTISFLLTITIVVSILSGLYPAFVLSSFAPIQTIRNLAFASGGETRSFYLRRGLIVFQFAFAQILIVGAMIMSWQLDFMLNKDMGFSQDAIVTFYTPWSQSEKRLVLKQELARFSEVAALSMHDQPPAEAGYSTSIIEHDNGKELMKHNVYRKFGDTTYIHLYAIPLLAGRNLQPSDSVREFLINETYARQLGFKQPGEALGKLLRYDNRNYPVVGVVRDFHIQSLHNPIQPVAIANETKDFYAFSLKLDTQGKQARDMQATIHKINKVWKEIYPKEKFNYTFIDESIARFYESEQRSAKLLNTATGIAVFISCLGLFGLAAYTAQTRTKEIGVRKVLGASVLSIIGLLSKDFMKLVLIANLIAWPLAWWSTHEWLKGFAYQIDVNIIIFLGSGIVALCIALLAVSYQSFKAAVANPVNSLRSE